MANYTVTNHEYTNTGGNCMVSVFTVYDRAANAIRFVACDDERLNWMTFDTIHNELPNDDSDYEDYIIETYELDLLVSDPAFDNPVSQMDEEKFLLFKHCEFEHYKEDCKYFGYQKELSIEQLPGELYNELGTDVIEWCHKTGDLVKTNGSDVYPPASYEPPVATKPNDMDAYINDIKDFRLWLDTIVCEGLADGNLEKYYDKHITIVFNGKALELMFAADEVDVISDALLEITDRLG